MNNRLGKYFLLLATVVYFFLMIIILSLVNSTLSQVGIYLVLPALFLAIPSTLNKYLGRSLVIINGFLLDFHCSLPLGFSVFFLMLVYLIVEDQIKLPIFKNVNDRRIVMIFINSLFFFGLFVVSIVDGFSLTPWIPFKFFSDLFVSSTILFFILPSHYAIVSLLDKKMIPDLKENHI